MMSNETTSCPVIMDRCVYVTILQGGGGYLKGTIALAESLRRVHSSYPLVACCSNLPTGAVEALDAAGVLVEDLHEVIPPAPVIDLNRRNGFGRWNRTFSKLSVLGLTKYRKIVLVDSDMYFIRNADELFECPSMSAVVAGHGAHSDWVDLNSGLMVIEPSDVLLRRALSELSAITEDRLSDCQGIGDQDILKMLNPSWRNDASIHLPECYNAFQDCLSLYDSNGYLPFGDVKIVHFELSPKPWCYGWRDWLRVIKRAIATCSWVEINTLRDYLSLM